MEGVIIKVSSKASELLDLLIERKNVYEELYNTDVNFKNGIDMLFSRLDLMSIGSKKYPYDDIDYSVGRYYVYLREVCSKTYYGNDFWYINHVDDILKIKYEISEDLKYFRIDNGSSISVYNVKSKTLKK